MITSELIQQRLRNQKLSFSNFQRPVEVVRWFGAVQAQDFNGAKWALALRMKQVTEVDIEAAFNRGEILRTHLLRPTWHFVAPEDIRWLLELTAPRINVRCGPNYRKYELDAATLKRSNKIISKALQSGKPLTRAELKAELNRSGVAADDGVRLAHILLRAELDGVICSGPRRGKQFTYALLEQRASATTTLSHEEALATLTRRYFASHGPATLQDYIWWSGLTAGDARHGIALIGHDLEQVTIAGRAYWVTRSPDVDPTENPARSQPSAFLLPAYDEYNVAYKDHETLSQTIVVDGTCVGAWKAMSNKNSVTVVVNAYRALRKPERLAVKTAMDRYARFVGRALSG